MKWVNAAKYSDLEPGACRSVDLDDDITIAIFNVEGEIFALDNTCPHAGGPLGEGSLEGDMITCPWHGWKFYVKTGECQKNPVEAWKVQSYPVRIQEDCIQISLSWDEPLT